ncbi:hypothetical protein U1701_18165 [Sphingomonas sp. PB2P19]|uniref:hypothetical protein n=1 Tax=Sphingomonas rhamnosi TaxID=3096156 RepID=UPI002FC9026F
MTRFRLPGARDMARPLLDGLAYEYFAHLPRAFSADVEVDASLLIEGTPYEKNPSRIRA